ncbi:glycosyltransferase family 4 protein [Virgisporangium aurantiacum]|uniref:GDP-mannose-dependent alpha-mannosyltransferase n=1 Tax=Virgisporangium aurantiacum TaxID=175570 RepID=A0A8J3Z5X1_9ACTN|nr:glycosyltransferase family 1 protein [Virgisporangium aurantiacum]GIJ57959.1 GDP-mannose-dependent alpha-mannosyltransferase [Virgisporangium aurantiacum]
MRVAIVTESFPPDVNGVANSVVRVADHLRARGHEPLVVAPAPAAGCRSVAGPLPYPVVRVPSVPMPGYPAFRLGLPSRRIAAALRAHHTDVVHLASPFFLGGTGSRVTTRLGLPSVAVYQTDVAAYARLYRFGWGERTAWRWLRQIHNSAGRTLAPSTAAATALLANGIRRVWLWRRGVDAVRFDASHRSAALRRALAPNGEVIVGYVGRVAAEKRLDLLAPIARQKGVRLVIVGAGPAEEQARAALPGAVFLGARHGGQLARLYASFDVFAHAGPFETFGQTIQEAMASGLPVVAPAAGGPVDLVTHDRTGFLVPAFDAAALGAAVAKLVEDPELRASFGAAARAEVAARTWAAIGDELIDHYVAVHSGGLPAAPRVSLLGGGA